MDTKAANQRLFDEALNHIRRQGKKSINEETLRCEYRNPEGLSCAFAPAIANYNNCMEYQAASDLINDHSEYLHGWVLNVDGEFANSIQEAHDYAGGVTDFLPDFESRMKELAYEWKLEYNENS